MLQQRTRTSLDLVAAMAWVALAAYATFINLRDAGQLALVETYAPLILDELAKRQQW